MSERKERCETCRFGCVRRGYETGDREKARLADERVVPLRQAESEHVTPVMECRRYPPTFLPYGSVNLLERLEEDDSSFPSVFTHWWCGEWRAKEAVEPAAASPLWESPIADHPKLWTMRGHTTRRSVARRLNRPTCRQVWEARTYDRTRESPKPMWGAFRLGKIGSAYVWEWFRKHFPKETASGLPESSPA